MERLALNIDKSSSEEEKLAVNSLRTIFNNTSILYRRVLGRPAKVKVHQWQKILPQLQDEEVFIDHITEFINCMIEELGGLKSVDGSAPKEENPVVEDYPVESLSDLRAKYISQVMVYRDEKTLDSREIRLLLEQQEQKPLFRSQIARVIKAIPKFLAAKIDIYSGKSRVVRNADFFNTGPGLNRLRLGS